MSMQGVSFDKKHSYRTWRMLLKSDPVISPPKPKKKLVEVPGTNKVIDLTESLTGGEVKYHMRSLSCVFYVIGGRQKWPAVYSALLNEIHGKNMQITLDNDPNYYYIGRVEVDEYGSDEAAATIVVTAELEPYKRARYGDGRRL